MKTTETVKRWTRTSIQNLVRHQSGIYYARVFTNGKETWKSLRTDLLEVAKVKLRNITGEIERAVKSAAACERGRMSVGDCSDVLLKRLEDGYGLKGQGRQMRRITPSTRRYRKETLAALWSSWPELRKTDVRRVSVRDVEDWAQRFAKKYSATRYNATLDTLRSLFRIAHESGARLDNPTDKIGRMTVKQKLLVLPEREQFSPFVTAVRTAGGRFSNDCADFIEFLAYVGARKNEASHVVWSDVDFFRERIHLRITKGGKPRFVPMIPAAKALLARLQTERTEAQPSTSILRVKECQKAMDRAAKLVGIARITHHDLRHLFATQCIESGVDIPTVSRWMGHLDGGALAMRTYGHLRDEHSSLAAKKVSFTPRSQAVENVIPIASVG